MSDMSELFRALFGTALILSPFPLLIWMAVTLWHKRSGRSAAWFFCIVGSLLGIVYFGGLIEAVSRSRQGHPGQAAMTTAATVVCSYGILTVALIARCRLGLSKTKSP